MVGNEEAKTSITPLIIWVAATKLEQKELQDAKTIEHKIPESLLGIGVRIEDNILCTDSEPVNLTEALPRSIDEIENICS